MKCMELMKNLFTELKFNHISNKKKVRDSEFNKGEYEYLQYKYSAIIEKLKKKIKQDKKLKVAFLVDTSSKFASRKLFSLMEKEELFVPYILVIPTTDGLELYNKTYNDLSNQYKNVFKVYDEKKNKYTNYLKQTDIAILNTNDQVIYPKMYRIYNFIKHDILTCLVYYSYSLLNISNVVNTDVVNLVWKYFVENKDKYNEISKIQAIKGKNLVASGYPKMDSLHDEPILKKDKKTVLICSHHTIWSDEYYSCFLTYCDFFAELPKKYSNINFIFRPHPLLNNRLKDIWGKEKVEQYWNSINSNENAYLDESAEYLNKFANSDGIIHDCGSFLAEYLFTGNPQCYLIKNKNNVSKYYNAIGMDCLENSYLAYKKDDIVDFIENVIIKNQDVMKKQRADFVSNVLKYNYPNSSMVVLDYIKNALTNKLD